MLTQLHIWPPYGAGTPRGEVTSGWGNRRIPRGPVTRAPGKGQQASETPCHVLLAGLRPTLQAGTVLGQGGEDWSLPAITTSCHPDPANHPRGQPPGCSSNICTPTPSPEVTVCCRHGNLAPRTGLITCSMFCP